jgi:predicted N-formylglutamate amidohydrolase
MSGPQGSSAFETLNGQADRGVVVICDHASNVLPPAYGTLGLDRSALKRHIGYDIGVAAVTRRLCELLDAPGVLSTYSRLLIDPNRGTDDPTLVMRLSDGAVIPGNLHIDPREIERRMALYYEPYHAEIDNVLNRSIDAGRPPAILSIHSYTPAWRGVERDWHAGVLWDKDPRFAKPLIHALESEGSLIVGDNKPYSGRLKGDCLYRHGTRRGLAHGLLEIRQDLILDDAGIETWAQRLARLTERILADAPDLHEVKQFGSHAD